MRFFSGVGFADEVLLLWFFSGEVDFLRNWAALLYAKFGILALIF